MRPRPVGAIAAAVVADSLRRRIVYVVLIFAAVLAFAIPSLPDYGLGVEAAVYREVALALTYVTGLVLALSLAANRIPSEVERRTVFNVLAKPVGRAEYVVGTWLGVFIVLAGAIAAFTVVEQVVAVIAIGEPMWVLWQGALAVLLEMGVIAGFTVAVSTVAGPVVVVVAALAVLFLGHARNAMIGGHGVESARLFVPSLEAFNVVNPVAHGSGVELLYIVSMVVVFLGLSLLSLLAATALLNRRDL